MTRNTAAQQLPSRNLKRSIVLHGHKTSVSLEKEFIDAGKSMAAFYGITWAAYVQRIDDERDHGYANLSSAIRLRILRDVQAMAKLANELRVGAEMREELSAPLAPH